MKIRFKFSRRINVFITIFASCAIVAMMIVRFQYPVEEVLEILWVTLFFLVVIVALAAAIGFVFRWIAERRNR